MKGAGRDGTKLYGNAEIVLILITLIGINLLLGSADKFHPWVNGEALLEKCLIGFVIHDTDE